MKAPSRRGFLLGGLCVLAAPAVIRVPSHIMPISAAKLTKLPYLRAIGPEAGTVEALAGSVPPWMIPLDGRMLSGNEWPELFKAVRGYAPRHDDEWLPVGHWDGHPNNSFVTVDRFISVRDFSQAAG